GARVRQRKVICRAQSNANPIPPPAETLSAIPLFSRSAAMLIQAGNVLRHNSARNWWRIETVKWLPPDRRPEGVFSPNWWRLSPPADYLWKRRSSLLPSPAPPRLARPPTVARPLRVSCAPPQNRAASGWLPATHPPHPGVSPAACTQYPACNEPRHNP